MEPRLSLVLRDIPGLREEAAVVRKLQLLQKIRTRIHYEFPMSTEGRKSGRTLKKARWHLCLNLVQHRSRAMVVKAVFGVLIRASSSCI